MTMQRRRFLTVLLALTLGVSGTLYAQWQFLSFEVITVTNVAVGFTASKITPNGAGGLTATAATCWLANGEVQYEIDGPSPTASAGMTWAVNTEKTIVGHDALVNFRAIRDTGTNGVLSCTYASGGSH